MSSLSKVHLLITGGAGFIGSWLAEYALSKGAFVTVLDDLSTGLAHNLERCFSFEQFRFVEASVTDITCLKTEAANATHIAHLASPVGVDRVTEMGDAEGVRVTRNMIEATAALVEIALEQNAAFFLASSSEVYVTDSADAAGSGVLNEQLPINLPVGKRWWYARMKYQLEQLVVRYGKQWNHSNSITIGRLFNVTGPRQRADFGMVLPSFMDFVSEEEPLRIYGSGQQVRSFCHVFDVVQTIWDLLMLPSDDVKTLNIGVYQPVSMTHLARHVLECWDRDYPDNIQYLPEREEEVQYRAPDVSVLQSLPVFQPKADLKSILDDYKQYIEESESMDPFGLGEMSQQNVQASISKAL